MRKNNEVKFEILHLPPINTNSLLVSCGTDAVVFDAWGNQKDWEQVLLERGLKLRAIYSTHGHPDHISAAPALARAFGVDWYLNKNDEYLIGWGNELLDMFNRTESNFNVYRSANIDNPGEEYTINAKKSGYTLRKAKVSER